jgi:glycosyltransferase involved in cell wall biosynthesis
MLGRHAGYVPFVGEVLGDQLARCGYPVVLTSDRLGRVARLADMSATLIRRAANIDVQIVQVYGGLSFVGEDIVSSIGALSGHRMIMHLHGGAMPTFMARYPNWTRRVLGRAAAIVAPSRYLQQALSPFGFEARVIANAIDLSAYSYRRRREIAPRLFWMRTFHSVYNPELAVRVLARVRATYPDATLVMAGQEKGTQAEVKRLAAELRVDNAIRFPGFLDFAGKMREGDAADIFLNTNRIDNTPVSVIEAGAMGLPVVATRVGGIADLLTADHNALLVDDDDDRAMADAVVALLRDPELAGRLSDQGRRLAETFSWEQTRPQWERLIHEVVAPRAALRGAAAR